LSLVAGGIPGRGGEAVAGAGERIGEGDGGDISGAITELVKSPCNPTKKVFKKF